MDETCVEIEEVVVVLVVEVVPGIEAAHKRGGLESYPVRMLFTDDWYGPAGLFSADVASQIMIPPNCGSQ